MSVDSREKFVEAVLSQIRSKFPLVKAARGDAPFSLKVNGMMAPLENLYRVAQLQPEDQQHCIDRWMVELLRAAEGSPDNKARFSDVKERIMPLILPATATDAAGPTVFRPLLDHLRIGYAIDSDSTITHLSQQLFERWHISMDELHDVAIDNLIRRSEAINAQAGQDEEGNINIVLFQTMDGYDSARLLLPTLHERLREHLGSPFLAGVPNRDILLCFRNDPDLAERMQNQMEQDYQSMPHQISERLVLVTADGLAENQ